MRIGFLSDLHITHNASMIEQVVDVILEATKQAKVDKLFIAGDTTNDYRMTLEFIDMLDKVGIDAYTIFGNHEYWSINYEDAQKLVHDRYINGKVVDINNDVVVIGIDGFFDYSFVREVDNVYTRELPVYKNRLDQIGKRHFDLKRNKIRNYKEVFNAMEMMLINQLEANKGKRIIVMTHYVPNEEFVLYNSDKTWTANNAFMGSKRYQEIAEKYKVDSWIFGHTHQQYNESINGINYYCNPIGYKDFEFTESFRERVNKMLKVIEI